MWPRVHVLHPSSSPVLKFNLNQLMLVDLIETFQTSIGSMGPRRRPAKKQNPYDVRKSGCERLVTYG